jgi:hypothetical protein
MSEEWRPKEIEWTIKDVGAPLLDSIAGGLYSKLEVLREYVQNASDSYVDFQRITGLAPQNTVQVWVDPENMSLHIMDLGVGMDYPDLIVAKKIGVSPKLPRPNEFSPRNCLVLTNSLVFVAWASGQGYQPVSD